MLGIEPRRSHRALVIETEPFLDTVETGAFSEIHEQRQVQHQRGCEDRVSTEEVDLDLHRVTKPTLNVEVVPALFFVAPGRVVVDSYLVVNVSVKIGVDFGLQNVVEHPQFADFA